MAAHETFHHELSPTEYAALLDAQFAAVAAVLPVDAFKNNVPTGAPEARRELWWCDIADKHIALQAEHMGTLYIGDPRPERNEIPKNLPRMRKVVSLLVHITGEGVDDGFYQDTQLIANADGSHGYEIFEPSTAEHLVGCSIQADELLRSVGTVASRYIAYVSQDCLVMAYAPERAEQELAA